VSGTTIRLGKLFNAQSNRAFVVAFDHGQSLPIPPHLGNPVALLERIVGGAPEGILVSAGMLAQAGRLFARRGAPAVILRADWTTLDPRMKSEFGERYRPLVDPADAVGLGADALCTYLIGWPEDGAMFANNVEQVAATIQRAHRVGLPVIVEATLWGSRVSDQRDPEALRQMCRIAAELGADAIKTEFVGEIDAQRDLIEEVGNIPVLTLGGAAAAPDVVAQAARDAISAGVRGLIFGRNVWQVADLGDTMRRLSAIVHGGEGSTPLA